MHPIRLRGARTHKLQGIDLDLFPGELTVVTGVSGAGKSSLAMDTLYAEGQRRFVESFSPYARQFLERLERPDMDALEPVAAAVAVDRRAPIKSSRSTVATMADLEAFLSALFTACARPLCPDCGELASLSEPHDAAAALEEGWEGQRAVVTYPLRVDGMEAYLDARERLLASGYRRVWVERTVRDLDEVAPSEAMQGEGRLDVVVDRVKLGERGKGRLAAALEEAWGRGDGRADVHGDAQTLRLSRGLSCGGCGRSFVAATSGLFSYQSPLGACAACRGFGRVLGIDWGKVIPDPRLTLAGGAIRPFRGASATWERRMLKQFCAAHDIPLDVPWRDLSAKAREQVLQGEGVFRRRFYPGVRAWFRRKETKSYKMHVRVMLARYRSYEVCPDCDGKRLSRRSLGYRVDGLDLGDWHRLELRDARKRLLALPLDGGHGALAQRELADRLEYLERVGLGYLTLDRQARTLSGGEAQRVSLTAALGSALTGALFVLDEPTVGLHPADVDALVSAMGHLARRGNVVLVVEHDAKVIRAADRVVELGPGAGSQGGRVVFDGPPSAAVDLTLATARALRPLRMPERATSTPRPALEVRGARANNLRDVTVTLPLECITCVCGPSGSGKSTLVEEVLFRALSRALGSVDEEAPGEHDALVGAEHLARVSLVDQAPLGRTSRGNAATYSGAWTRIRALFAATPEAELAGLTRASFSFNVAGGRCESCAGEGAETVEMQFLADVRLTCPVCRGTRFQERVLDVRLGGRNIADLLAHTVDETLRLFAADAAITRALRPIAELGLGYLPLGQPLSTLSGGEAQRLKLARALHDKPRGTLLILDEPSAGLHVDETMTLLTSLRRFVGEGGSVVMVEHDPALIAASDHCVELGPGAGVHGGAVLAVGPPAALLDTPSGRALCEAARATGGGVVDHGGAAPKSSARKGSARRGKASKRAAAKRAAETLGAGENGGRSRPWASVEAPRAIEVRGAREHNLDAVDVEVRHGELTVVTGPSGSGKSSLAFDVIFAEGQRRFLETLTPYARQFLPVMPRPAVDRVSGVPPAIALEQRTTRGAVGSTVATVTEIAHYLRLLFAKVGTMHCPACDVAVETTSVSEVIARVRAHGAVSVRAPVIRARKGTHFEVFVAAERAGLGAVLVDGARVDPAEPPKLPRHREHDIDFILFEGRGGDAPSDTIERALTFGDGQLVLSTEGRELVLSTARTCPRCDVALPELDPRWFSFNTAQGRCSRCDGTGYHGGDGAVREAVKRGEDPTDLGPCTVCDGARLAPVPRAVRLFGERYHELTARSVTSALAHVAAQRFEGDRARIAQAPHGELRRRLAFVDEVGLGYLSLDRRAATLSGGELQRLRLAAQLGSGLTGALYVLDEPTIGLHPRDTARLLANLRALVDTGSTVLVVEHDADTIRAADRIIDLGPSGGRGGGRVMAVGSPKEVLGADASPTARALSRRPAPRSPRPLGPDAIVLTGARAHNLAVEELRVPTERMTVVAGVSGSGKSSLVTHVLYPAVRRALGLAARSPGAHAAVDVPASIQRAVAVDQAPLGRTSRSVPATFLDVWDPIRRLYAALPEARARGFSPTRFSFNSAAGGGRCAACDGNGEIAHEMAFLPDMKTRCETCEGMRFEPATLEVRYRGLSIGDALRLTVEEATREFAAMRKIAAPLETLCDLGVGYVALGQGSPTLSGGEAQRLKLAKELSAGRQHRPTLYVLDEPTTGLHHADVGRLLTVLERLVERGDTLVIIEHHPEVIAAADHVVELGPEGGEGGGRIVATGTPEEIARAATPTAAVVRATLERHRPGEPVETGRVPWISHHTSG